MNEVTERRWVACPTRRALLGRPALPEPTRIASYRSVFIRARPSLESCPMKSYEVIREAVDEPGVKAVAAKLKVSAALVYKWCEPPADAEDPEQSGARNPLDRVRELYTMTKDIKLIRWLCNEAGGFFVANPELDATKSLDERVFAETRNMVRDFSELLDTITESLDLTPGINRDEADQIRQKWEDLKGLVERFTIGCEKGFYHVQKK